MAEKHVAGGPGSSDRGRGFLSTPSTKLGRWSVALLATFAAFFIINSTVFTPSIVEVPRWQAFAALSCGLAAGIVGLIAVTRRHERSWLVWLAMLPGLMIVVFALGEFLAPH